MDWYETERHNGAFYIAGYETFDGDWQDVENGDPPLESHGADVIGDLEGATIHFVSAEGDGIWLHVDGPFDSWDDFAEYVEYMIDHDTGTPG